MSAEKAKKTKKIKKTKKTDTTKRAEEGSGKDSVFQKWVASSSLRPAVLGDSSMAVRLHSLFLNDPVFEYLDMDSLFEYDYCPNLLILAGPISVKSAARIVEAKQKLGEVRVIYVEQLLTPSEEPDAIERARSVGADVCLAKEFVTMENIKEAIKRVSNV